MVAFRWRVFAVAALLALAFSVQAQQPNAPHVGYVYPAGGRQGTTFKATVGGQFLDGVSDVYVSGEGVQTKVIEHIKPMPFMQLTQLREKLKELTERKAAAAKQRGAQAEAQPAQKATWGADDEKALAETRMKIATALVRPASPSIGETVILEVTLDADAAVGERALRLGTPTGLTNPLVFCVGQLPEFSKAPAKTPNERPFAPARAQPKTAPEPPMNITLPAVVNGQIMPGGADRYRFQASKGQHLVVAASARQLIPYISDAVPGWFQAALMLQDAKGKEVDYADHFRFHPDPVLYYEIPSDGEYTLTVHDSIYRGREDFVYRAAVGELPFVTAIFPLGGKAGAKTTVELKGWNLPVAKVTEDDKLKAPGLYPISVRKQGDTSNRVPYVVDSLAEKLEKEPNSDAKHAQKIKFPVIVNGRIDRPGDWDVYRFDGRAGEEVVAEVLARRLDSPLDSVLKLTDASGRQLAANDDYEDKGAGLLTHQADSRISFKLPAKGSYYVYVGDTENKGGPEYGYRLRLSRPRPDFELRVAPSSLTVRGNGSVAIAVYALRRDGFNGDIALRLVDAPPGFILSGAWIPAGQDKVRLTLTAPPANTLRPYTLHLEGSATIEGREVRRAGVPAEDMMQAFAYHHLVPQTDWMVFVTKRGQAGVQWKVAGSNPVKLRTGGTAAVEVAAPIGRLGNQLQLVLSEPPEGISIQSMSPGPRGMAIVFRADAAKVKPGLKGNLIVDAFMERQDAAAAKRPAGQRRQPIGTLPAIPFEVVAQ